MNFIKDNKTLILKYLFIISLNILLSIVCSFYLGNMPYVNLVLLLLILLCDYAIYRTRTKVKFIPYLDMLSNILIGAILMLFIKENIMYSNLLVTMVLSNNIIFIKSRLKEKKSHKFIQYIMVVIYTIISTFINIFIFNIIK